LDETVSCNLKTKSTFLPRLLFAFRGSERLKKNENTQIKPSNDMKPLKVLKQFLVFENINFAKIKD